MQKPDLIEIGNDFSKFYCVNNQFDTSVETIDFSLICP